MGGYCAAPGTRGQEVMRLTQNMPKVAADICTANYVLGIVSQVPRPDVVEKCIRSISNVLHLHLDRVHVCGWAI